MECKEKCPADQEKGYLCCDDCAEEMCFKRCHSWKFDCRMMQAKKEEVSEVSGEEK